MNLNQSHQMYGNHHMSIIIHNLAGKNTIIVNKPFSAKYLS